jgi:hypothetical protein
MQIPHRFIRRPLGDRPLRRRAPNPEFRDELVVETNLDVMVLAIPGGALRLLRDIVDQEGVEA